MAAPSAFTAVRGGVVPVQGPLGLTVNPCTSLLATSTAARLDEPDEARLAVRLVRAERREIVAGDGALVPPREAGDRAEAAGRVARRRGGDRRVVRHPRRVLVELRLVEDLLERLALLREVRRQRLLRLLRLLLLRLVDRDLVVAPRVAQRVVLLVVVVLALPLVLEPVVLLERVELLARDCLLYTSPSPRD